MRVARWIGLVVPLFALGQSDPVSVRLDTTVIRIGEQTLLHLEVVQPAGAVVQWPTVADTLNAHLEVVHDSGVDTISTDNALIRQVRTLRITSFDTGFWAVPPFRFAVNARTVETEPLLLEVRTVPVDPAKPLHDIKDIVVLPFSLGHWIREHLLWIGGTIALLVLAMVLYRYSKKARTIAPLAAGTQETSLHQRIIEALQALDRDRIWQQGDHKGYHSRLTDLLRSYLEERYQVPALESTTDELLRELRVSPLNADQRGRLENMLRLADMVKFAKALPSPQENEQMMVSAVRFVQETVPHPNPPEHG